MCLTTEQGEQAALGRLGDRFRRGGEEALDGTKCRDDGRPALIDGRRTIVVTARMSESIKLRRRSIRKVIYTAPRLRRRHRELREAIEAPQALTH